MPAVAFSYVRFSHPSQAEGDSLRRQTEAAAEWCRRNGVTLDTTTTLHDLGKSAFAKARRDQDDEDSMAAFIDPDGLVNPDRRALAGFQTLIKRRRVQRGAFLVIENLDRLSRDDVVPATHLLTGILLAGVKVVQLKPIEQVLTDKSDGYQITMAVMELSRGHGESAMKSERLCRAWAIKKAKAREGRLITRTVPAWMTVQDGKVQLIPEKAETVRALFRLAAAGYGNRRIVAIMSKDGTPPIGAGPWDKGYVGLILRDRRAVGEYQPKRNGGQPDGDPVPGYFPAAVTEDEYHAARATAAGRKGFRGRVGNPAVNVFAKMVRDARDGCAYTLNVCRDRGKRYYFLTNMSAAGGTAAGRTFPYPVFERAVLSVLRENAPADVGGDDSGSDRVAVIRGQIAGVKVQEARLEPELLRLDGDVPALARALETLREREKALKAELAKAQQQARPADSWKEAASLTDLLDTAADPEDVRVRLRAAFRRVVSGMVLLVCPRGREKFAVLDVTFTGGGQRHYFLYYRPRHVGFGGHKPGRWAVRTWTVGEEMDLRTPDGIRRAEGLFDGGPVPAMLRGELAVDSEEFPGKSGVIDRPAARPADATA